MRAIFIGGPMDRRMEEVPSPPPPRMFALDWNGPRSFSVHEGEGLVSDVSAIQVEYERTISSDGIPVYVAKKK